MPSRPVPTCSSTRAARFPETRSTRCSLAAAAFGRASYPRRCPGLPAPMARFLRSRLSPYGRSWMRVVACTVVHHPADARIFYREIQALLDAGHDVTYIAPHNESAQPVRDENSDHPERVRGSLRTVTIPRAVGRRRLGALRAARAAMAAQSAGADLLLVHDPELVVVLPRKGRRPPTVWDIHEDTVAAL